MSLNAVSDYPLPPLNQSRYIMNSRFEAAHDQHYCWNTAAKVFYVAIALIASIGGFAFGGPLVGCVFTLMSGIGLLWFFNSYSPPSHSGHFSSFYRPLLPISTAILPSPPYSPLQSSALISRSRMSSPHVSVRGGHHPQTPSPWHHQVFPIFPSSSSPRNTSHPIGSYIGMRQRHHPSRPHVSVGRGHFVSPPEPISSPPPSGRTLWAR